MSHLTPFRRRFLLPTLAALAAASTAGAQWAAYPLDPGVQWSDALGGDAARQAGAVGVNDQPHAAVWSGTPGSFVDLHPAGFYNSRCSSSRGGVQGGWAHDFNVEHAGRWTGTAGSWTDLHPLGYHSSRISGVDGSTSVGAGIVPNTFNAHAGLWNGSSFTDLNPVGASLSWAYGCFGSQQVGVVQNSLGSRAYLWTGSAASGVDLSPAGCSAAWAFATDGSKQVGIAEFAGVRHAALWSGSAASFVDLHPWNSNWSEVNALDQGVQVGWSSVPFGSPHAILWSGTAGSFEDLHVVLPSQFTSSRANAVWHVNGEVYVLGTAIEPPLTQRAFLWKRLKLTTYCTAKVNSLGCTPQIAGLGNASATSNNSFTVRALNLRNQVNGLLFYGVSGRDSAPFAGGTMCVAAPRMRAPLLNSTGNNPPTVDCSGFFLFDMNAFRGGWLGGSPAPFLSIPGTIVDCQYWARDPGFTPPNAAQLSNALEYEIGP